MIQIELEKSVHLIDFSNDWLDVINTLRVDVAMQRTLRSAPQLDDHVYWKSERLRESVLSH
jgi:hypothetical protein